MLTPDPAWEALFARGQAHGSLDASEGRAPICDVDDSGAWDYGYLVGYIEISGLDGDTVLSIARETTQDPSTTLYNSLTTAC